MDERASRRGRSNDGDHQEGDRDERDRKERGTGITHRSRSEERASQARVPQPGARRGEPPAPAYAEPPLLEDPASDEPTPARMGLGKRPEDPPAHAGTGRARTRGDRKGMPPPHERVEYEAYSEEPGLELDRIVAELSGERDHLLDDLADLETRARSLSRDSKEPRDTGDLGANQREIERLERRANATADRIDAIQAALGRAEQGLFGICQRCGEPIRIERLRVEPETSLCIRCVEAGAASSPPA